MAPLRASEALEFAVLRPWVCSVIPKRARAVLDVRAVGTAADLVDALQDHLMVEGNRTEGQAAVFRKQTYTSSSSSDGSKERKATSLSCFTCGKPGHKAADCWQGKGSSGSSGYSKPVVSPSASIITCYNCGKVGHKSPQCPEPKAEKAGSKEGKPKPVRRVWHSRPQETQLEGSVNGVGVSIVLDSGASISVVPELIVAPDQRTGRRVAVRAFGSKVPVSLPIAEVTFKVGDLSWVEEVPLAPEEEGYGKEVLYGLDLKSKRGLDLVLLVNGQESEEVLSVTTRSESKAISQREGEEARVVEAEKPKVKEVGAVAQEVQPTVSVVEAVAQVVQPTVKRVESVALEVQSTERAVEAVTELVQSSEQAVQAVVDLMSKGESPGEVKLVADRPASGSEPVASDSAMGKEKDDELSLEEMAEACDADSLVDELDTYDDEVEGRIQFELRSEDRSGVELEIPPVGHGSASRAELVKETEADPSLKEWRRLAELGEKGFSRHNGLLYQATRSQVLETNHLIVLPQMFRLKVLQMAHEGLGHLGARKVKSLIRQRFTWPGVGQSIMRHCRSCVTCQRCSKAPARKAPLIEREVLSEPFESLAFDIVGPMPKGKGGCRFLLTAICMASKWPEAIPLRSVTAKAVAKGMIEIFAHTGIPLRLLTDQGSQFLGSLVTQLCRNLGIEKIKMTPYHPEGNGVVERMHGTLGAMLTKASSQGLDWVEQVPFALFALRSSPNRDTLFSPYQLVYGHQVRTPLDILHQGWAEVSFKELDVGEWAEWLIEKLEVWHDVCKERGQKASGKRKEAFDKKAVERNLDVNDLVLCRVPGMVHKLQEAWHGPYPVLERTSKVDYRVNVGRGRSRVLHVNNLKKYHEREEAVMRLAVVAENWEDDCDVGTRLEGVCEEFDVEQLVVMQREYPRVFSDLPGKTGICKLSISIAGARPVASPPYRIPDRLKEGVRSEILKLEELEIVVPSTSPWGSPVVPVPKSDGTVRICIDYRRLNEVTEGDPFYMCTMEEIIERVGGSMVISKLDLAKGFFQIEVEEESRQKTAFITPFGKFEFKRMPFDLKNAPAIFQRTMEVVLIDCYDFSAPYIDDIVVFSADGESHAQHLRLVFAALDKQGLTVKLSKCEFGKKKLEYLGHVIGGGELAVPSHRATAMTEYLLPRTKRQLRSFLGAASYYRRFVQGFARLSSVLSPATSKIAPSVVGWTDVRLEAFHAIKVCLINICVLTVPSLEDVFTLHTDASGAGIGATLNVIREGEKRPVAFFSRQLQGAQKRYSATELECLAIFKSIYFFSHFLYGRRFEVVTDHQALVSLLKSRVLNRRLQGWMLQLLDFDFYIVYRAGKENSDADALSRQAWDSREGDPGWIKEPEEKEKSRTTGTISFVGGDVGPTHIEEEKNIDCERTETFYV